MSAAPMVMPVSNGRLFLRGLLKHCPNCGQGHLFRRWFKIRERCPRCGLLFERIEGHWTGDLGINTIVSFGSLMISIFAGFIISYPKPPSAWLFVIAIGIAAGMPLFFYPFSKTIWLAVDIMMRPLEPAELVAPTGAPATDLPD